MEFLGLAEPSWVDGPTLPNPVLVGTGVEFIFDQEGAQFVEGLSFLRGLVGRAGKGKLYLSGFWEGKE